MLIPSLDLWENMLKKKVMPIVYEDNQATAKIIRSGKFEKLRHVDRTHGVQLSFVTEQLRAGRYEIKDCHTRAMAADVFTKFFVNKDKWVHAITLIGMWQPKTEEIKKSSVTSVRKEKGKASTLRKEDVPNTQKKSGVPAAKNSREGRLCVARAPCGAVHCGKDYHRLAWAKFCYVCQSWTCQCRVCDIGIGARSRLCCVEACCEESSCRCSTSSTGSSTGSAYGEESSCGSSTGSTTSSIHAKAKASLSCNPKAGAQQRRWPYYSASTLRPNCCHRRVQRDNRLTRLRFAPAVLIRRRSWWTSGNGIKMVCVCVLCLVSVAPLARNPV